MFWNKNYPSKAEVQWMNTQTPFTPDMAMLEEKKNHLLFNYDPNAKLPEYEDTGLRAYTRHKFQLYIHQESGVGIPIMGKKSDIRQPLRIKGKILKTDAEGIKSLDFTNLNGKLFNRVRVPLLVPSRQHEMVVRVAADGSPLPPVLQGPKHFVSPEKVAVVESWMYVGASKHWKPLLDDGYEFPLAPIQVPREPKPWLERFYQLPRDNG